MQRGRVFLTSKARPTANDGRYSEPVIPKLRIALQYFNSKQMMSYHSRALICPKLPLSAPKCPAICPAKICVLAQWSHIFSVRGTWGTLKSKILKNEKMPDQPKIYINNKNNRFQPAPSAPLLENLRFRRVLAVFSGALCGALRGT